MRAPTSSILLIIAIVMAYLLALVAVDGERDVFSRIADIAGVLPTLFIASFLAYALRALRWVLLLRSLGHRVPFLRGLVGYIAGFAFTASPGKAGELVRIRYFGWQAVPASSVIAAFVFERALDLVVLLCFASLLAQTADGFGLAVLFVALVLAVIVVAARRPRLRYWMQYALRAFALPTPARVVRSAFRGIEQTSHFMNARLLLPTVMLGLLAWGVQCFGYALTLKALGVDLPALLLFSIPPAAILIGAASLMPGGVGTTEAATIVLLSQFGTALDTAVLASIALRLGSIWFATILGFAAVALLELRHWQQSLRRADLPQITVQSELSGPS